MDVRIGVLTAGLCCLLLTGAGSPSDGDRGGVIGFVAAGTDDNSVKLKGSRPEIRPGSSADRISSLKQTGGLRTKAVGASKTVSPLSAAALQNALNAICVGDGDCGTRQGAQLNPLLLDLQPADPAAPVEAAVAGAPARVVTIEDVARFLPATVELHAEPDGWAVVGVPANFWTYVRPVTVAGELLGEEAAVRFTPQLYRWDYGDGTARTTRSGGASWSGLGQEELSPTATSHLYRTKSAVDASVTVIWSAEYRFAGGDWIPVAGAVSNASPQTRMLVVKERTVLTAG